MKIDQKFRNGLLLFVQEQKAIFSRRIGYCFPILFLLFCNLKIPKQGIKMQIFSLNRLLRLLKNGHLPVNLHSSDLPPGIDQPGIRGAKCPWHGFCTPGRNKVHGF